MIIEGRVHKFGDFINTDIHCSSKYAQPDSTRSEILKKLFFELKPDFSQQVNHGDIIAAGESFGTVSTREEAPELLREIGVQAVLAKSFGYLFYRNAINLGLPVIECNTDSIQDGNEIIIDLMSMFVTIRQTDLHFRINTMFSEQVFNILKDGGLIPHLNKNNGYRT